MLRHLPTLNSLPLHSGARDTDPSLSRAMGGGTSALTHNVRQFREIVGHGEYFGPPKTPRRAPDAVARPAPKSTEVGLRLQRRASERRRP
jgi:hypothetical protein